MAVVNKVLFPKLLCLIITLEANMETENEMERGSS